VGATVFLICAPKHVDVSSLDMYGSATRKIARIKYGV